MRYAVPALLAGAWHAAGPAPEPPTGPPHGDPAGLGAAPATGTASADVAPWAFIGCAALILLAGIFRRYRERRVPAARALPRHSA